MAETIRRITTTLEGAPEDGGAVRLEDLQRFLREWMDSLRGLERRNAEEGKGRAIYRIAELQYASPVRISVDIVSPPDDHDLADQVEQAWSGSIEALRTGTMPEGIDPVAVSAIEDIGKVLPPNGHVAAVRFVAPQHGPQPAEDYVLDRGFAERMNQLLGGKRRSYGSLRGHLEVLSVHGRPFAFLYPPAGPDRIKVLFPEGLPEGLGAMVERRAFVRVEGTKVYRANLPHPLEIHVKKILLLDPSKAPELPELYASMPNLTGGLSSAEYLAMIRNETIEVEAEA